MKKPTLLFSFIISSIMIQACSGSADQRSKAESGADSLSFATVPSDEDIAFVFLEKGNFDKELLANGRLSSLRKANLNFRTDGIIQSVLVREGESVRQGQKIAVLDGRQAEQTMANARLALQQAQLDYEDQLLRAGFKLADSTKITAEIKSVARIRSGLEKTNLDFKQAKIALQDNYLLAPFNGKVASLKAKAHNKSNAYDFICTLVDDQDMEVIFHVLEQELPFVRNTNTVDVIPFGSTPSTGAKAVIRSINPIVDEQGMVEVKAHVSGRPGTLIDGMKVDVRLRQKTIGQFVVPKDAVLDRQNRKVVFTLVDSLAKWNYVEIGGENSDSYLILSGLKTGDKVIYRGNFNLSHDKVVHVAQQQ